MKQKFLQLVTYLKKIKDWDAEDWSAAACVAIAVVLAAAGTIILTT